MIQWLDGEGLDRVNVGLRAALLARLRGAGLAVPRAFVLGRKVQVLYTSFRASANAAIGTKLPAGLHDEIAAALRNLGGAFAIRRSLLEDPNEFATAPITLGGRPERETYLHLVDIADVIEAIRRIWGGGVTSAPPPPVAIIVQRFIAAEAAAFVRRDPHDENVLQVVSSHGVGDLLSAGLVVPDRHTISRADGSVITSSLGRKAQMSIPRLDGGLRRVPVPTSSARRMALDLPRLADLAEMWRKVESQVDRLRALSVAIAAGKVYLTTAVASIAREEDGELLG